MAKNCKACEDLRETAPDFMLNGVTTSVCTSLKNNTGLNPGNSRKNCKDLEDANDCLINNMGDEVDAYDVCDWKEFMKKFIPNVGVVFEAFNCAMCGLWDKISSILSRLSKAECQIELLFEGFSFQIGETATSDSYIVPGVGVSYAEQGSGQFESDISLTYIAGGLVRGTGQVRFHTRDWEEKYADINGNKGKGNSIWGDTGGMVNGNELIYEIRIKNESFPFVKSFFQGIGQSVGGPNGFTCTTHVFRQGTYAYGQHGRCNTSNGDPAESGFSRGHRVDDGWTYIQVRMSYIFDLVNESSTVSSAVANPTFHMGIRMSQKDVEC